MKLGPNQKKWIAALRANPEEQIRGFLGKTTDDDKKGFCCLGKGCDVLGIGIWEDSIFFVEGVRAFLPEYPRKQLGLVDYSGTAKVSHHEKLNELYSSFSLSEMNDEGKTWSEIADILEKHPEAFFFKSV